ncbi:hypothetical protein [Streptomyces sp. NPDC058486]
MIRNALVEPLRFDHTNRTRPRHLRRTGCARLLELVVRDQAGRPLAA